MPGAWASRAPTRLADIVSQEGTENMRKYLGVGAFIAAAIAAIGAFQCYSVYIDENTYSQLHPYTALSPELVTLSGGAALGCLGAAIAAAIVAVFLISGS
jgi:hypothetical protein